MIKKSRGAENQSGKRPELHDLQASVRDKTAFRSFDDFIKITSEFLQFKDREGLIRIVSPTTTNYFFYQFGRDAAHKITRPLNSDLFSESAEKFRGVFSRFVDFLSDLKKYENRTSTKSHLQKYIASKEINQVVYTIQQAIGSVGDSFENANQSRKRVGDLFESLIRLIINEVGVDCESRTVLLPIPGYSKDYRMSYQLDLVFSRNKAIITGETKHIHADEIVGSVKITSKDRIDKLFLDKFLLSKLLGRDIPVIAVFLHDVQRAIKGRSIFGVNSTFKTNHFLAYTVAMNRLDGVYYVDPRPNMVSDSRLKEQVKDFQRFLTHDLWSLTTKK